MRTKHWLGAILFVYVVLAVVYSWVVPLGEAPDEIDHFLYVRYLREERAFPVMKPIAADNETMEANQPPLFYLLNAVITAPFPITKTADLPLNACFTFDPHDGGRAHFYLHDVAEDELFGTAYLAFRAARLVSVLLGAITVWLAYCLGRQLVRGDDQVALLAAGLVAFNPQFIFMTASVNNDVLTAVIGAALVVVAVQAAVQPRLHYFAGLGVLLGLALLTKLALFAFWPLAFLAALIAFWRGERKVAIQGGVMVAILPLLIGGWWYVRAMWLYGDPLAWDVHLQAKGSEVLRTVPLGLADLGEFARIHFQSYWAWFGWLKIQMPGWVYGVLAGVTAVAVIGLFLVVKDWRVKIEDWRRYDLQSLLFALPVSPLAVLFNVLATAAIYASLLRYIQTINWSGYQGRLAYAAVAPIATLLGLGWWRVTTGRYQKLLRWLIPLGLGLLSGVSLWQLSTAFARPALYAPSIDWERVCLETDRGFYVEAVQMPSTVLPGERLSVRVGGYGVMAGNESIRLALLDWVGMVRATAVADLLWAANQPISTTLTLQVPPDMSPMQGQVQLQIGGEAYPLPAVKIAPVEPVTAVPTYQTDVVFADQMRFVGYDLTIVTDGVLVTLIWEGMRPMGVDYTTYVHLLDRTGNLIAQSDSQPQAGQYPTSIWTVGERIVEQKLVIVPSETAVAELAVGVYELATRTNLQAAGQTHWQWPVTP